MSKALGLVDLEEQHVFVYDPLERVEGQAFIRLVKVEPELHGSGLVQVQMKHSNVFADYSAVSYM